MLVVVHLRSPHDPGIAILGFLKISATATRRTSYPSARLPLRRKGIPTSLVCARPISGTPHPRQLSAISPSARDSSRLGFRPLAMNGSDRATYGIKITNLLDAAGWIFFPDSKGPANIQL